MSSTAPVACGLIRMGVDSIQYYARSSADLNCLRMRHCAEPVPETKRRTKHPHTNRAQPLRYFRRAMYNGAIRHILGIQRQFIVLLVSCGLSASTPNGVDNAAGRRHRTLETGIKNDTTLSSVFGYPTWQHYCGADIRKWLSGGAACRRGDIDITRVIRGNAVRPNLSAVYLSDELCDDHPSIAVNNKNNTVRRMIGTDRHVTHHEIRSILGMSRIQTILHKHLGMKRLCSRWFPHNLTEAQKTDRVR
ncbi:hypothetical protein EVAR_20175_1 [Eumeta japonica]|uniref:Histone-lysine N-methyltransferase SETMAR n=1 Tax=Eumeta variegata TaxID=151549 RepID=A0A4C1UV30_EUMVA|nr:hypothetical protein EVAR_20175_1 [Eumeta japonica]